MICLPLLAFLGTGAMWGLLPFLIGAVLAIWWGLERSYRDARQHEVLTIGRAKTGLCRTEPDGRVRHWDALTYWVKAHIHHKGGPVSHYLTLTGSDREVEIGAFLSEEERLNLLPEIEDALHRARSPLGVD